MAVWSQAVQFKHYSVKEGISQSEIKCIYQDSEGFLWIGTQNGLNQFNGYGFEKFTLNPNDPASISNNWIFGMAESADGSLWIATKGGLNRCNRKAGTFTLISHKKADAPVRDNYVYGVATDDSCVYINIPPALSVLHIRTGELETYVNSYGYDGLLMDIGFPILCDRKGFVWVGSMHGLSCFNPLNGRFVNYMHKTEDPSSLSHDHITALYEDNQGNLWVGTQGGLNLLNRAKGTFVRYMHDKANTNSLSSSFIRSIWQDHTGTYWVGTEEGGLNRFTIKDQGMGGITHFRSLTHGPSYISHDIVYSLCEDRSNNLWIGTIAGLDKLDLKRRKFNHYSKTEDPMSLDLLDNVIASLFEDEDSRLWIGNWNKGLNVYDRRTGAMVHFNSDQKGKNHIPENNIHVLFRDSQNRIWVGTRNGIFIYKGGRFEPFQTYFGISDNGYFKNNRVYCIIEDSFHRIWIGTGNGIFRLNTQTRSADIFQAGKANGRDISNNLVYSLLEDSRKHIWVATSSGLDRYVPDQEKVFHYSRNASNTNTLCDNYVISLCEDVNRDIWIGTSTGVNHFIRSDSSFRCFTMQDGLPSNIIYDIVEDRNHDLWFTTGNGLARYNMATRQLMAFALEEGVQGMEFNIKAVHCAKSGELFFGGMDGFISFFPDSLAGNTYIPAIRITRFEKENNGIRSKVHLTEQEVKLSYNDYSFTIEFAALDFTDPLKNQYAYQLEPLSDKWIDLGNQHFVHFTNLPPGKYVFRVKGSNNDGIWNEEPTSLIITIAPPWWKSRVALWVYALILVFAIFGFIRWRERKLMRDKKTLENKVLERTEEIERQKDKLRELNATKDKFFSILAHDLKGPFSSLYSMSELLSRNYSEVDEDDRKAGLSKIYHLAELIYKLLENLLTWSKAQRGTLEFNPVKFNLSQLVEVNVNLHKLAAGEKEVLLRNRVEKEHYAYGDSDMINTVIRNLVHNAVKFTHRGKSISVEIREQPHVLELMVRDEGVGISAEDIARLFRLDTKMRMTGTAGETGTGLGLLLCREFVTKNGGSIWCESEEHKGTTFYFTVPRG